MLLEMDVHRVRPIARQIGQKPLLHTVLLDREAEVIAVHELAIDRPLAVQAIELERAHDSRRRVRAGQLIEARFGGRIHTVVGDLRAGHPELQNEIARARPALIAGWLLLSTRLHSVVALFWGASWLSTAAGP